MWIRNSVALLLIAVPLASTLDNGLALKPPMGWISWQRFRCVIDCEQYPDDCIRWFRVFFFPTVLGSVNNDTNFLHQEERILREKEKQNLNIFFYYSQARGYTNESQTRW